MKKKWLFTSVLITGIMFIFPIAGNAVEYTKVVVNETSVDVRVSEDDESIIISKLFKGEEILIIEQNDKWIKIKLPTGIDGYISKQSDFLSELSKAYITHNQVNLRMSNTTQSEVLHILNKGDSVKVVQQIDKWIKVEFNSIIGYIHEDYITFDVSVLTPISRSDNRDIIALIDLAKSKLGSPYVYGNTGPDSFDCSGFVFYSFKNSLGIELPRVSSDQSRQGRQVSKDELQMGDIVYFDTNGGNNKVNHVGIYISDGEFIHASSGNKMKVMISSLDENHYKKSYMGATRIVE